MYKKKSLSSQLTLFYSKEFPKKLFFSKRQRYQVVIGIGGNIGDTRRLFQKLFYLFMRERYFSIVKTSPILKNPPFGYHHQPFFYNAVIVGVTPLSPTMLLQYLQHIEKKFRRKRSFKDAPRTLDLDIIFYEDKVIKTSKLIIPHKEWHKRESVLIPLMEVAYK